MLPLPSFHDPAAVASLHVERGAIVADAARAYRNSHRIRPASEDTLRIAAFGIDPQVGFCHPSASLFVPGAVEDTARTLAWLYGNLDRITKLFFSLDTHGVFQIFHPSYWRDATGAPPPPFTSVTAADVRSGKWIPVRHPGACLEYVERLEASGKYVLTIWPFHTLLGGISHALMPALMEAAIFHSLVRDAEASFETKGEQPLTESYSVLAPEVREVGGEPVGTFNEALFDALMHFDRIYVFGQAKSHCVLSTLRDMRQRIEQTDPALMGKVWILEDAMSPVPPPSIDPLPPALDFPRLAEAGFAELRAAGMKVVRTTDPILG